ncbi:ChbG/HpnK family deacetylase [Chitinimonas naiadis]
MTQSDIYTRIQDTQQRGPAKRLVLCADDYALNEPVSEAILTLLSYGRISVAACFTGSPLWPAHGTKLREAGFAQRAGLHYNLTQAFPGAISMSTGRLMLACRLGLMDGRIALATLQQQLDDYEDIMQAPPAFLDGHQHIHVFPGLEDVVLTELDRRYGRQPWIRAVSPLTLPYSTSKAIGLRAMGAKRQEPRLHVEGWRHNHGYGGLYAMRSDTNFGQQMAAWMRHTPNQGLVTCHPANAAVDQDPVGAARLREYNWLKSEALPAALKAAHAVLVDAPDGVIVPPARIELPAKS